MTEGFGGWLVALIVWVLSYLMGSIPVGVLMAKWRGEDLREQGSGNIGATNAFRVLGPWFGLAVLALDALKGVLSVWLAIWWLGRGDFAVSVAAIAAVSGHVWPCWLGFKGGKGVATMVGCLLMINLPVALLAILVWGLVVLATRYVSLASLAALVAASVFLGVWQSPTWYVVWTGLMIVFLLHTHRENWQRLLTGTESRFSLKASS